MSLKFVKINLLVLLLLLSAAVVGASAQTVTPAKVREDAADAELWSVAGVSLPLTKRVDANFYAAYFSGQKVKAAWIEIPVKINKYLTLAPSYVFIAAPPLANRRYREQQLRLDATVRFPVFRRIAFDDRNLFERRIRSGLEDTTRYRNRLRGTVPFKIGGISFRAAAYAEIFYEWRDQGSGWTRERLAIGAGKTFAKRFSLDGYLLRQNDFKGRDTNAVFLTFITRFDSLKEMFKRK